MKLTQQNKHNIRNLYKKLSLVSLAIWFDFVSLNSCLQIQYKLILIEQTQIELLVTK